MVGVHSKRLASVITRFVGVLIIHIVGYSNLGEYAWMISHEVGSFFFHSRKLVSEAVSDGCLTHLDGESGRIVFPS